MAVEIITSDHAIVHLAKARALLLLESSTHMPSGAKTQRAHVLQALERIIDDAATGMAPAADEPQIADSITWDAWRYVQSRMTVPHAKNGDHASDYEELLALFDRLSGLSQAGEILEWIQQAHAMPLVTEKTLEEAITAISIFAHRLLAAPLVKQWVENASPDPGDTAARRNAMLMHRQWLESAGLNETLVVNLSRACSASFTKWETARPKSDFAGWLPCFEEVIACVRGKAHALGQVFEVSDYQAMLGLSSFNPGLKNETVNAVFGNLRRLLPGLVREVMAKQSTLPSPLPLPEVSPQEQKRVALRLMHALGLEEKYARLDESAHPFSTGQRDDVRITTHYNPLDMLQAIMGVIHETGHALYSRGLPEQWRGQPVGEAQSMWVHESQSLFWEMQIASGRPFMEFLSSLIREELGVEGPAWSAQNLYRLVTTVAPTPIRTDADEVTYPAHVILRHDLEQKLISGALKAADVPAAWGDAMRGMLGIEVSDHAHGCMQDVHWPTGAIGYFPAYTFGALAAAQLMQAARKDLPGMDSLIRKGEFSPIRQWLDAHVYCHGALYDGEDLIAQATGKPLSEAAWTAHIHARYLNA